MTQTNEEILNNVNTFIEKKVDMWTKKVGPYKFKEMKIMDENAYRAGCWTMVRDFQEIQEIIKDLY